MIYVKQGDTRPAADTQLSRGEVIVDLTLASSVTFKMRPVNNLVLKVDAAAVVTDAVNGLVEYRWDSADTDLPGRYDAEWEVLWSDGTIETFPTLAVDTVLVSSDLDGS